MRISITIVQRIWAEAGLKPHRTETFKFSTDPDLAAKIRDVVGLDLNPPERAIRRGTFESVKALVATIEAFTRS